MPQLSFHSVEDYFEGEAGMHDSENTDHRLRAGN